MNIFRDQKFIQYMFSHSKKFLLHNITRKHDFLQAPTWV
jgi:hypothetical protein